MSTDWTLSPSDETCPACGSRLKVENLGEYYCRTCETGREPRGVRAETNPTGERRWSRRSPSSSSSARSASTRSGTGRPHYWLRGLPRLGGRHRELDRGNQKSDGNQHNRRRGSLPSPAGGESFRTVSSTLSVGLLLGVLAVGGLPTALALTVGPDESVGTDESAGVSASSKSD